MFDFPGCHLHFSRSLFCGRILSLLGSSCRPERWSLSITLLRFVTIHLCKGMIMFGKRVQEYDYVWYPRLPPVLLQEPLLRQDQRHLSLIESETACWRWMQADLLGLNLGQQKSFCYVLYLNIHGQSLLQFFFTFLYIYCIINGTKN